MAPEEPAPVRLGQPGQVTWRSTIACPRPQVVLRRRATRTCCPVIEARPDGAAAPPVDLHRQPGPRLMLPVRVRQTGLIATDPATTSTTSRWPGSGPLNGAEDRPSHRASVACSRRHLAALRSCRAGRRERTGHGAVLDVAVLTRSWRGWHLGAWPPGR
jgi:hypothetical protein